MMMLQWLFLSTVWLFVAATPDLIIIPTIATTASVLPSATGYNYIGCYNETTGLGDGSRALYGGKQVRRSLQPDALTHGSSSSTTT